MITYIYSSTGRKSGGASSQNILSELILSNKGRIILFKYVAFRLYITMQLKLILQLFSSNLPHTVVIPILYLDRSPKYFLSHLYILIKESLNHLSYQLSLKALLIIKSDAFIFEHYEPFLFKYLRYHFPSSAIYSLLRSSPHCLVWSSSYIYKQFVPIHTFIYIYNDGPCRCRF